MKRVLIILAVMGAAIGAVSAVTFTVNQNEYAVKTEFGKPVETITEPGLKFQWPAPIQRVNRFDRRLQLHQGLLMETLTRDKKNIALRCVVVWRI
ncbi:MAG TPA: SPFH domain-containing protein, partial [bacterium]|nr:SPFH domain-containing protein [bacterium]